MTHQDLSDREISRLVALLHGELGQRARKRLEAKLEKDANLRAALEALRTTRRHLEEIGQAETPPLPYRQIEAKLRWAQRDSPKKRRAPWRRLTIGFSVAAAVTATTLFFIRPVNQGATTTAPVPLVAQTNPPPRAVDEPVLDPARALSALPTLIEGRVRVAPNKGAIVPLTMNRPIHPGERLLTTRLSRVSLQWQAGSGLALGPKGELQISQLTTHQQSIALHRGQLIVSAGKSKARQLFEILAGSLRLQVLGTRFGVWMNPRSIRVEVYEGMVLATDTQVPTTMSVLLPGQRLHFSRPEGQMRVELIPEHERKPYLLAPYIGLSKALAETGTVAIRSQRHDTNILLDGQKVGRTKIEVRAKAGRHLIALKRGAELIDRRWIGLVAGSSRRVLIGHKVVDHPIKRPPATKPKRVEKSIYEVFRRRTPLLRACYRRALRRKPNLSGKIVLRLRIGADGRVQTADVVKGLPEAPEVGRCARAIVRSWAFPKAAKSAVVTYPLLFRGR